MSLIKGTAGDDPILDFTGGNILSGEGGNDTFVAFGPSDIIVGADGNDLISADGGNNSIYAFGGNNTVSAEDGDNNIYAGSGQDKIDVGDGKNLIYTGDGDNIVHAGNGDNDITGGSGNDLLVVGSGNNDLSGGAGGNDTFVFRGPTLGTNVIDSFNVTHDTIDLHSIAGFTADELAFQDTNTGVLITAKDPSVSKGSILLLGVKEADLNPGNFITAAACFLRGTLLDTPDGPTPVESLQIGDLVVTLSGIARPVKWIGRRSYRRTFIGRTSEANPVVFKAGSLGEGLPRQDLLVSGKHAMFFDGAFVRAEDLVNGVTITRESTCEFIDYFHVELETPDVIFANGAATETYANHNSRRMFANWQEYADLYGSEDAVQPNADGEFDRPYPLVTKPGEIAAITACFHEAVSVKKAA